MSSTATLDRLAEKVRDLDPETKAALKSIEAGVIDPATGERKRTLADAMRVGSLVTEQKRNGWFDDNSACALSAALIAVKSWSA